MTFHLFTRVLLAGLAAALAALVFWVFQQMNPPIDEDEAVMGTWSTIALPAEASAPTEKAPVAEQMVKEGLEPAAEVSADQASLAPSNSPASAPEGSQAPSPAAPSAADLEAARQLPLAPGAPRP